MEIIKVTVVKTMSNREPVVYKSEDWEILKPLAIDIQIEQEYMIYAEDGEAFCNVVAHVFNLVNEGRYYSTSTWLNRFRNIISKVNQVEDNKEKNKQPKGIMAAYALEKLKEYE